MACYDVKVEDLGTLSVERLAELNGSVQSKRSYENWIDNLDCKAEKKNALKGILDFSCKVCGKIYQLGKIVLEACIAFVQKFPCTAIGLLIGTFITLLLNAIPVIGSLLSGFLMPVTLGIPVILGFLGDIQKNIDAAALKEKLTEDIKNYFK